MMRSHLSCLAFRFAGEGEATGQGVINQGTFNSCPRRHRASDPADRLQT